MRSWRGGFALGTWLVLAAGLAGAAAAAEGDPRETIQTEEEVPVAEQELPPAGAAKAKPEEIVVTGSRIERTNLDAVGPLSVVSSDEIALSGFTSVDEVLRQLPSIGLGGGFDQNGNNGGDGLRFIDLRSLGSDRTLVLLDGRRVPLSSNGTTADAVDIGNIPVALIDRVELLRDGASAIYGSDAIAGVVNFVLKDRFEGLQLDLLGGTSQKRDGSQAELSLTGGKQIERANLMFNVSWTDRGKIQQSSRDFSKREIVGLTDDNKYIFGSSLIPEGRVDVEDASKAADDPERSVGLFFRPDGAAGSSFQKFESRGFDQRFNFGRYQYLLPPAQRLSANFIGSYEISDGAEAYFNTMYTRRDSWQSLAPTPLGGSGTINNPDGLVVPLGQFPADFRDGVTGGSLLLPGVDPGSVSGSTLVPVARRVTEAGPRLFDQESQSVRFTGGLRGELASTPLGPWKWDAFFNYGRTDILARTKNSLNLTRANIAADPARCAVTPGCTTADFIGRGSLTPEALSFFRYTEEDQIRFHLKNVGVSSTGPVAQLPAGSVQLALGAEYRQEDGVYDPDPVKAAGDSANSQVTKTRGDFSAKELFWELEVPLADSMPFADKLVANLAGRLTDYDTFGSAYQYRYALVWSPLSALRLRAVTSTSFRAPGVTQLFGGNADDFRVLNDPCDGIGSKPADDPVRLNCIASGVPVGFTQADGQIRRTVGGNPDLKPEESKFYGVGMVWTPESIPDLSFTVDYFNIRIDHAIENPDSQFLLDACAHSGPGSPACAGITRGNTGAITQLGASLANIGKLETDGLEFELRYGFRMPLLGDISVRGMANYLFDYTEKLPTGVNQVNGTVTSTNNNVGNFRGALVTTFAPLDRVFLTTNLRFLSGGHTDDETGPFRRVPGVWYLDTALRFEMNEAWSLSLGLQNATNKMPPRKIDLSNTDPSSYDFVGRFAFARLTARF